jgi:hypothetical protein
MLVVTTREKQMETEAEFIARGGNLNAEATDYFTPEGVEVDAAWNITG